MKRISPVAVMFFWLFIIAAAGGTAKAQAVYTPFSNLGQVPDDVSQIGDGVVLGVSFTTESTPNFLVSVSARLDAFGQNMGDGTVGPFIMSLCSDAGGSPGGTLATLSGSSYPIARGIYTYTNLSALTLSANTTYWLVASSPGSVQDPFYEWASTPSTNLDSGSFWPLGVSEYDYGGWNINSGEYFQFSITVATTNLPALAISQPVVLTYTTIPGVPFILQESPVLPGTNWVTATNAIQMAAVNTNEVVFTNQTVFIVPPTGQRMYFRLSTP
jgi:hypothetical protein